MFTNTYVPHVGGVARSVSCFEEDLRRLGHRVLIIAPTYTEMPKYERGKEVLRVPAIQNFNGSDFSARIPIPFLLKERIDEFSPDIIHSHHPYLLGDAAMRVASRRGLPLVFTHHTLYEEYAHYVSSSMSMKKFVIHLSTAYANYCTSVIAPSRSVAELLRERGVSTPVAEIPTGIDYRAFQKGDGKSFRENAGIDDAIKLVGHVGRLAPEKNLRYLIDAVKIYLRHNKGAKFLVVGDGPDLNAIRKSFEDDNLETQLILAGKKTGTDLVNAYCAMDLFVFSSHSETQGLVVTEAMAAGIPVIALDASGVREVVSDNKNGRLLTADAPVEEFAEAISYFFENPDRVLQWHENALATARLFDRQRMADKLLKLYENTLEKVSRPTDDTKLHVLWENLLHGVKTEWDLLSTKVGAIADSIGSDQDND